MAYYSISKFTIKAISDLGGIAEEECDKLIDNMSRRVEVVIRAKGCHMKCLNHIMVLIG